MSLHTPSTPSSAVCQDTEIEKILFQGDSGFFETWRPKTIATPTSSSYKKNYQQSNFSTVDQYSTKENQSQMIISDLVTSPPQQEKSPFNLFSTYRSEQSSTPENKKPIINFGDIKNILNLKNRQNNFSTKTERINQKESDDQKTNYYSSTSSHSQPIYNFNSTEKNKLSHSPEKPEFGKQNEDIRNSILSYFRENQEYFDLKEISIQEDYQYDFKNETKLNVLRKLCELLYEGLEYSTKKNSENCEQCAETARINDDLQQQTYFNRETFDVSSQKQIRKQIFDTDERKIQNIILDDMITSNIQLQNVQDSEIKVLKLQLRESEELLQQFKEQFQTMEIEQSHQVNLLNKLNKDLENSKNSLIRDIAYLEQDLNVCVQEAKYNKSQADLKDLEIKRLVEELERITLILERVKSKKEVELQQKNIPFENIQNERIFEILIEQTKKEQENLLNSKKVFCQIENQQKKFSTDQGQLERRIDSLELEDILNKFLKGNIKGELGGILQKFVAQYQKQLQENYLQKYQKVKHIMKIQIEDANQKIDSLEEILILIYELQPHILKIEKSLQISSEFNLIWRKIITMADKTQEILFGFNQSSNYLSNLQKETDLNLDME